MVIYESHFCFMSRIFAVTDSTLWGSKIKTITFLSILPCGEEFHLMISSIVIEENSPQQRILQGMNLTLWGSNSNPALWGT